MFKKISLCIAAVAMICVSAMAGERCNCEETATRCEVKKCCKNSCCEKVCTCKCKCSCETKCKCCEKVRKCKPCKFCQRSIKKCCSTVKCLLKTLKPKCCLPCCEEESTPVAPQEKNEEKLEPVPALPLDPTPANAA